MPTDRPFRTEWGEHARGILRQYNECNGYLGPNFWGPHYVVYERGDFFLHPYGDHPNYRYSFECRPEFIPGQAEPLWTFVVLC
jgi:hypothetical protein